MGYRGADRRRVEALPFFSRVRARESVDVGGSSGHGCFRDSVDSCIRCFAACRSIEFVGGCVGVGRVRSVVGVGDVGVLRAEEALMSALCRARDSEEVRTGRRRSEPGLKA